MTYLEMDHIALENAYLCPDCDSIGNCSTSCPACTSTALISVAGIIDHLGNPQGLGKRTPAIERGSGLKQNEAQRLVA